MPSPESPSAVASLKRANRFVFFLSLMGPLFAVGVIAGLYRTEMEDEWETLEGVAHAQASVFEAVGAFDARYSSQDVEGGSFAATLSQILQGQAVSSGFRETGRIWIGLEEEGVLRVYGGSRARLPAGTPLDPGSDLHDLLGRALKGEKGRAHIRGVEGQAVLAYFQPARLPGGTVGLLVKVDVREVMSGFLLGGIVAVLLGGGMILLGWGAFVRVARPGLEAYARLEKRFRTLLEGADVPILYTSEDGRILEANPAAAAFVGLDLETFLSRTVGDFLPDQGVFQQLREEAWSRGSLEARTVRVRTEEGDDRWALVTAVASTAGDPEEPAMQNLLQDVTQLKQTEETASRAREHLKAILAAAPVGLGVTVDRILREVSPHFCRMLGYQEEELLGRSARMLYPSEEEFLRVGREKYGAIRRSGSGVVETRMRRKTGDIIEVLLSSVALDPRDLSAGVVFTAMDVTEIRRVQDQVAASEARLRGFLDNIPGPAFIKGPDLRHLWGNRRTLELTDTDEETLTAATAGDILPAEQAEALTRMDEEVLREGRTVGPVEMKLGVPGRERWLSEVKFPIDLPDGTRHVGGVALDVTARIEAQAELRMAHTALNESQAIMIWADEEGTIEFVNRAGEEALGYRSGELVGRPLSLIDAAMESEGGQKALLDDLRKKGSGSGETRFIRKDGSPLPVLLSASVLESDGLLRFFGSALDISREVEIREALRERERQLQLVTDHVPAMVCRVDRELRYTFVNRAYQEFFHRPESEFVGHPVQEVLGEDLFSEVEHRIQAALQGVPQDFEAVFRSGTLRPRTLAVDYVPELDEGIGVTGFVATMRDVTEAREADLRIQESETRFRAFMDHFPGPAYLKDGDGNVHWANRWLVELSRPGPGEAMGDAVRRSLSPEEVARIREEDRAVLASGEATRPEEVTFQDGENSRWFQDIRFPVDLPTGQRLLGGLSVEVTEQRKAREALQVSEARYRSLFDANPLPYQSLSPEGAILAVNPAWCEALGYDREEVVGRSFADFLHSDDIEAFHVRFQEFQACGEAGGVRWRLRRKSGSFLWAAYHGRVAYDHHGAPLHTHCVFHDVTEEVRRAAVEEARVRLMDLMPTASSQSLTESMVDEAEGITESSLGFLHILDPREWRTEAQVFSTRTRGVCAAQEPPGHSSLDEAGAWADAARSGKPLVHNDPGEMELRGTLPEGHAPLKRQLLVPILRSGEVQAVLGVANKEEDYTEHDIAALQELANAAWDLLLRRQGEEALRESQERYRQLFEAVNDPVVIHGLEDGLPGKIVEVNSAAVEMFGYSREELLTMHPMDIQEGPRPEVAAEIVKQQVATGSATLTGGVRRKDGRVVPVEIRGRVFELRGKPLVISALRDVSAWQEAEDRIRAERDRAQLYLDTASVILLALDREGRIEMINRAGAEILGYPEEELVGRPWFETALPDGVAGTVRGVFESAIQGNLDGMEEYENEVLTRSGERRMIAWKNAFLVDDEGAVSGSFSSGEDVTEKRRALRELEISRNRLRMLAERLTEIREAERASLARELHDELGQVLTGTRMELGMLMDRLPDGLPESRSRLLTLRDRMDDNIRRVRDLATFLRPPVLDVLGLKESVKWLAEDLADRSSLAVELDLDWTGKGLAEGAKLHLFRIFQEALTNVLRHAEAGWVGIRLRLEEGWVIGEVEDDGVGISRDLAEDLNSLGLLGIEERIMVLGGDFTIQAGREGGTCLTFRFPLEQGQKRRETE